MLQPVAVLLPDVELWATTYLRAAITARSETYTDDVFVSNRVPTERRDRMVIVRRDGGRAFDIFDDARLSVRVWATTEQDATDLSRMVTALLWAAPDGAPVVSVTQESGPSPVPDDSGQHLRYSVYTIRTRGEAL